MSEKNSFRTGELAKIAGVSTDTIRYYERMKLLPRAARTSSGYRNFSPEAVRRLSLIRRALLIGFTIPELSRILQERDRGGVPCEKVRSLAAQKLENIEGQILEMKQFCNQLKNVVSEWDQQIDNAGNGNKAHLLEHLPVNGISRKHSFKTQKHDRRKK